jgi:AraC family transcriptional regulator, exoenzyme S synthesis regulatory protein ExsA
MIFNLYELVKARPEYFKQLTCNEILITQYDCLQEKKIQDIYSQMNFIAYVISGSRTFFQPGYHIEMTEGKCAFAKKGGWLAEKNAGEGWCVLTFFIPDNYLRQFFRDYQATLPVKNIQKEATRQMIELNVSETTESCFDSMAAYFTQAALPAENLLELKFRELLLNILGNPANKELLIYLNTLAASDRQSLEEIMEANYTYNLPLEEFAKIAHRSLASFKREFNEIFKIPPGRWLIQKRLDYASTLLHTSKKSVNEIAFESGFENTTHFSRVFKNKFNVSPLAYRKNTVIN